MRKTDVNTTTISEKQFKCILNYVSSLRNADEVRLMMMFNYLAGMRRCNFKDLQLKDIIDENNKVKDIIILGADKNKGNNFCNYYVSNELKKEIERYIKDWNLDNKERYLFVSVKTGKPYNKCYISQLFTSIYKVFGIHSSTHSGRHQFITSLLDKGVNISVVQHLVNHKNYATTAGYYNASADVLKHTVNLMKI